MSKLLKNFFSVLIGRIGGHGLSVVASIYLARVLHPHGYGVIGFFSSYVSLFTLLASLGIPVYGARQLARMSGSDEKARFAGAWMGTNLLLAVAAYILFAGSLWLLRLDPVARKFGLIWGFRLIFSGASCYWIFQAHEKMGFVGLRDLLKGILYCGSVIAFIRSAEQLLSVAWLGFGSNLFGEVFLLIILFSGVLKFIPKLDLYHRRKDGSLKDVAQIGFALLMVQVYYRTDSVIIGLLKGQEPVGLYAAVYQLIFVGESVAVLYFVSILPRISSFWQGNKDKLSSLLDFSMSVFVTLGFLLGIAGVLFSKEIVRIVYGAEYLPARGAFSILIWSMVMTYTALTPFYFLMGTNFQKECSRATVIAALVNLALNFPLIIYYGIHGAAVATVASKVTEFAYVYRKASEKVALNWNVSRALRLALAAIFSLGMGLIIRRYEVATLLSAAALCILYFSSVLALRVISIGELRESMRSIEK